MDDKLRDELLKLFRSKLNEAMTFYLETCMRCGVCVEACHAYASMGQVKYIAAYRAEIIRRIYKKYFKPQGRMWSSLGESKELSEMALDELYDAAYSCTGCRRCMVYCPFGIDTQMIMSIAKLLLIGAEAEPDVLTLLADTSIEKGKSIDLFKEGFMNGLRTLEKEVLKRWKGEAGTTPIPVEVEGRQLICITDQLRLVESQVLLSPPMMLVLMHLDGTHPLCDVQAEFQRKFGLDLPAEKIEELVRVLDQALLLLTAGLPELARERADAAHDIAPDDPEVAALRGLVALRLGEDDAGRALLRQSLDAGGTNRFAEQARAALAGA